MQLQFSISSCQHEFLLLQKDLLCGLKIVIINSDVLLIVLMISNRLKVKTFHDIRYFDLLWKYLYWRKRNFHDNSGWFLNKNKKSAKGRNIFTAFGANDQCCEINADLWYRCPISVPFHWHVSDPTHGRPKLLLIC